MNLEQLFQRDAAIVDHSWMQDGLVQPEGPNGSLFDFDTIKNPNNVKPELEIQWGGGTVVDIDEPTGVVKRNIDDDAEYDVGQDAHQVIVFARDMMNRGLMGRELSQVIRDKFSHEALCAAGQELREQLSLEGIVGCIAVDGRGYGSCREALCAAENSPYKRFIKYVIGCECGDHQHLVAEEKGGLFDEILISSGNPSDDFLSQTARHSVRMASHCRSTMLMIMGQDIDPSEVDSGLIDLVRTNDLSETDVEKLQGDRYNNKYSSNKAVLRAAFRRARAIREASDDSRYAGHVDTSEFKLKQADNEIELAAEAMPDIEIDTVPVPIEMGVEVASTETQDIDMSPLLAEEFEGTDVIDLDVLKAREGDLNVEFSDPSGGIQL